MKRYFSYFVYLSFCFMVYFLYKLDYFQITEIEFSYSMLISLLFLCAGFLCGAIAWWKTLVVHGYDVTISSGIASHGLVMFAKYIPGKAWTILGRAAYVSKLGYLFINSSLISLKAQIIAIWTGLLLGSIACAIFLGLTTLSIGLGIGVALLTLLLVSKKSQLILLKVLSKLVRKDLSALASGRKQLAILSTYYGIYWILLMVGFYFLLLSLHAKTSVLVVFVLPLAITLGVLAIVSPGGLGIREGIMVGLLGFAAVPMNIATSISIVARLWFLFGELFIFVIAFVIDRKLRQQEKSTKNNRVKSMTRTKQNEQHSSNKLSEVEVQNMVAKCYEGTRYRKKYSRAYHMWQMKEMLSYVKIRGCVLDNGCGTGILFSLLPADNIYGSDISEEMLVSAKRLNSKIVLADSENLPFRKECFDVIISRGLLHHLRDPAIGIAEMYRILKPGGEVVLVDTNKSVLNWLPRAVARMGQHFSLKHRNFSKHEYVRLLRRQFKIEELRFLGYIAYPLLGFPDLVDIFRWFPCKEMLTKILIEFDLFISQIPLINSLSWGILVKAKKVIREDCGLRHTNAKFRFVAKS